MFVLSNLLFASKYVHRFRVFAKQKTLCRILHVNFVSMIIARHLLLLQSGIIVSPYLLYIYIFLTKTVFAFFY